jgi:Holliday junction resolvase RusA-like endonuclease
MIQQVYYHVVIFFMVVSRSDSLLTKNQPRNRGMSPTTGGNWKATKQNFPVPLHMAGTEEGRDPGATTIDGSKTKKKATKSAIKGGTRSVKGATPSKSSNIPKTSKSSKGTRKAAPKGPAYFVHPSDRLELHMEQKEAEMPSISGIRFKVRGNPRPLVRHRSARGFIYNPSSGNQDLFRNIVMELFTKSGEGSEIEPTIPIFSSEVALALTVVFRMRRPNTHFVASKREPERLRDTAPNMLSSQKQDVDNLAKFVMDSMNGILYEDDKQVISLHATKLVDNEIMLSDGSIYEYVCEGSTEVFIREVTPDKADKLIGNSFDVV